MSAVPFEWTEPRLAALRGVAEAAGAAILAVYARLCAAGEAQAVEVQRKADDSPLTEADLVADRLIRSRLALMFNGAAVLSEEGQAATDNFDPAVGYFLVDPLDGTKEFLARNGEFTVNVAWVQGARVLAGVVHAPALGETFWGAAGVGAWKSASAAPGASAGVTRGTPGVIPGVTPAVTPGIARPIRVAAPPAADAPLRVLASRSHGGAVQRAYLARLPQPLACLEAGSSLKFCRLAEGAADLYPRLTATMAWDTAAGQAVLEAAGGVVLGTEGSPLRIPGRPREAPNPPFFAASSAGLARRAISVL
ncbi:MAG: 3'(2'),5'-bisphosphate nucleotidase CysQ [Burkholderiales bacterium]|nr:3'(2'),5'-bisphosphate nucleotidase CysQ [Burkholderiales bacterium]